MRRLHVPLLTHVAVILTTLTLAACTSDQPAIPASSPTPTSDASPSVTALPRRSPTAIPTPPISDDPPPATITGGQFKTHVVKMRTGEVSALYEGNQH